MSTTLVVTSAAQLNCPCFRPVARRAISSLTMRVFAFAVQQALRSTRFPRPSNGQETSATGRLPFTIQRQLALTQITIRTHQRARETYRTFAINSWDAMDDNLTSSAKVTHG